MLDTLPDDVFYEFCQDLDIPQNDESRKLFEHKFYGFYYDSVSFCYDYFASIDFPYDREVFDLLDAYVDWQAWYDDFMAQGHFHTIWNDDGLYVFYN